MKLYAPLIAFLGLCAVGWAQPEKQVIARARERIEAKRSHKWAVIIGVNDYDDDRIQDLTCSVADAESVRAALTDPQSGALAGAHVQLLVDGADTPPTERNILRALKSLEETASEEDIVLVYFSGHGIERGGTPYLLPCDVDLSIVEDTAVPLQRLLRVREVSWCQVQVVILDACRTSLDIEGKGYEPVSAEFQRLLTEAPGTAVLMSAEQGQTSHEDTELGRSVYTGFLVEAITGAGDAPPVGNQDGVVTVYETAQYARARVRDWAFQHQREQTPHLILDVGGEVALALAPAAAPEPAGPSHVAGSGPVFRPGLTPTSLGWGPDDAAYPERVVVTPVDGAQMVWVPSGTFTMGTTLDELTRLCESAGWIDSWVDVAKHQPAHQVTISRGFWLYKCEVTNAQYAEFMDATGREPPDSWETYHTHQQLPVVSMTWDDAVAYSAWAGASLPTEAQWEWAARGPEGRQFPWGDEWDRARCSCADFWAGEDLLTEPGAFLAWLDRVVVPGDEPDESVLPETAKLLYLRPVGSFPAGASWCGALDMAGSAYEWCADWYADNSYALSSGVDPTGVSTGEGRVRRGGGWMDPAHYLRGAAHSPMWPFVPVYDSGFRPVVSSE